MKLDLGRMRVWGALAASLLFSMPAVNAGDIEKAIPEDTTFLLKIKDRPSFCKAAADTNFFRMWADPAMRPFVDDLKAAFAKAATEVKDKAGVDIFELAAATTGQIAVAVRIAENSAEAPFVYMVADCKGKEAAIKAAMDKLIAKAEEGGESKRMEGDFTVIAPKAAADKPRAKLAFQIKDGLFIAGNDVDALSAVIKNYASGMSGSLADNPRFKAFREAHGGESQVEVYADLAKIVTASSESGGPQAAMGVALLGLQAFQSAGLSMNYGTNDFQSEMKMTVLSRGKNVLFDLFNMPAKPTKPEAWVPADTGDYFSFNWDIDRFYTSLTNLVNGLAPGAMQNVENQLKGPNPDNPIVNLKEDVINSLGNRISTVGDFEDKGTSRSVIAWELRSEAKLSALIERLMGMAGGAVPFEKRSIAGNTVYTYALGEQMAAMAPDQPSPVGTIGLTVTKTHLMFATHVELLEKLLTGKGGDTLADNPNYRRVASKFPSQTSMIGYSNGESQMRAAWAQLKTGALKKQFETGMQAAGGGDVPPILEEFLKLLDGSKLPEFSAIKKYLKPSGSYGVMDDKGVRVHSFDGKE